MAKKVVVDERVGKEFEGRCMKCKQQRPFTATEVNQMKNGTSMAKGKCDVCGTTVCRMLGKDKPAVTDDEDEMEEF
jgi:uncharacterized protein DUF5679